MPSNCIFTPHIGEFSNLMGITSEKLKEDLIMNINSFSSMSSGVLIQRAIQAYLQLGLAMFSVELYLHFLLKDIALLNHQSYLYLYMDMRGIGFQKK